MTPPETFDPETARDTEIQPAPAEETKPAAPAKSASSTLTTPRRGPTPPPAKAASAPVMKPAPPAARAMRGDEAPRVIRVRHLHPYGSFRKLDPSGDLIFGKENDQEKDVTPEQARYLLALRYDDYDAENGSSVNKPRFERVVEADPEF